MQVWVYEARDRVAEYPETKIDLPDIRC
jgi:hypothetical protein